jgi:hypothetical protein
MRCIPFVLLVLLVGSPNLAAQEYPIKLDRLPKQGSIIEVASRTEQTGDLGAVLARPERWGVTGPYKTVGAFVIRIAIEEVDGDGFATKAAYQIAQCNVTSLQGGLATGLRGKVFQVSASEGKRMYLEPTGDGGYYVLDRPKASMLDLAVPMPFLKGEASLDAAFGTETPQAKGGKWNSDPQAIAASFAYLGASKDRAQGASMLKKVTGAVLGIESTLQLAGLKYDLPNGYVLAEDKFQMQLSTTLPIDETLLPTEQTFVRYTAVNGLDNGKRSAEWMRESGQARYKVIK